MRELRLDRGVDVGHQRGVQAEEVGEEAAAVGGAQVRGLEEALHSGGGGVGCLEGGRRVCVGVGA